MSAVEVDGLEELVALRTLSHRHGQVEHVGGAADRSPAELRVGDAPRQHLYALAAEQLDVGLLLGPVCQPQDHDLRAELPPLLREVGADEPGAAGHQEPHP